MKIKKNSDNFSVEAEKYSLIFNTAKLSGEIKSRTGESSVTVCFLPRINGDLPENTLVDSIKHGKTGSIVSFTAGEHRLMLELTYNEELVQYSCTMEESTGTESFTCGELQGDFSQLINYGADLPIIDIPVKITQQLTISSRKRLYNDFFQLDEGNFMMPPYIVTLYTGKEYFGIGTMSIPDSVSPFEAEFSVSSFKPVFHYEKNAIKGKYQSPVIAIIPGADKYDVLKTYSLTCNTAAAKEKDILKPKKEDWWSNPVYTSWGDQVYQKHISEGRFQEESGSEQYLSGQLIDNALEQLKSHGIHPKTIVIDEGWSLCLGDFKANEAKFFGSLSRYIKRKNSEGYWVLMNVNPFLADLDSETAVKHPDYLVKDPEGQPKKVSRSGGEYFVLDWSVPGVREMFHKAFKNILGAGGLNADGIKLTGIKYYAETGDIRKDPSYGQGESYLYNILKDIRRFSYEADKRSCLTLSCLNPLFSELFDIVRLGNASEVNHEPYAMRARTASLAMPDKLIDTDDWAAWQKVIGAPTYIKTVAGVPNIFSAFYRGDGRLKVQGASGGNPVSISDEQYRIIATAWAMYEHSRSADRSSLDVDFSTMEFSAGSENEGPNKIRTYQGGNILAVQDKGNIFISSLNGGDTVIDIPEDFKEGRMSALAGGSRTSCDFQPCLGDKIWFKAEAARDTGIIYQLSKE